MSTPHYQKYIGSGIIKKKGNSWEEFDVWIIKNYLSDVIKPVREMEIIKATLVNIKGNFEKQADNWRDNWEFTVNVDNQKLLPQKRECRFTLKKDNKLRINLKHSAHYILS